MYRQGTIVLEGKKRKIIVLDYNSNGRFDNVVSMPRNITGADNELVAVYGDALLIESPSAAQPRAGRLWAPPGEAINYLAGVTILDGKYYHFKVSPLGDELTWASSSIARGQVTSPHAPCQVELIGELGQISLTLEKSKPATVPAGQWQVLSYTIHVPKTKEQPKETDGKKKETGKAEKKKDNSTDKPSAGWSLAEALLGLDSPAAAADDEMWADATVSAQGTTKGELATVRAGETTVLRFGPPYKPRVTTAASASSGLAYLSLVIEGADGEKVSGLSVNGRRPERPSITDH